MRVLVTGAAGFVGRHLRPRLAKAGYLTFGIDKNAPKTDKVVVRLAVEDFMHDYHREGHWDVVIHLAANIVNVDDRIKAGVRAYEDLVLDYQVMRWLQEYRPQQVVIMSSCAIDGADDPYSAVKRNLEAMALTLHSQKIRTTILRPFSGYGHDQTEEYPFGAILGRILRHEDPVVIWGGKQVRDWLYIEDLVDAILWAAEGKFPSGQPVDIGTGKGTSLLDVARNVAAAAGYWPVIESDLTKAQSTLSRVADPAMARRYGWAAKTSFESGVREVLRLKNGRTP